MSVLITGGGGFLGIYVARALVERGETVVLYDRSPIDDELAHVLAPVGDQVELVRGDVQDLPMLLSTIRDRRVRKIVHAAALIDAQLYARQMLLLLRVNVEGAVIALEAARLEAVERFVYVSSLALYPGRRSEPIDEEHTLLDTTARAATGAYGASKAAAELFGLAYANTQGFPFVSLRLSTLYGFGMRQPAYVKPMVEGAVRGRPVRFATGADMRRNYVSVRDAARSILCALDTDPMSLPHRIFNACREELTSVAELASIVRETIPDADIEVGAGLSDYETTDILRRGRIDVSRAKTELGFEARVDLRSGIAEYADAYRAYLEGG